MIYWILIALIYGLWFLSRKLPSLNDAQKRLLFIGGSFFLMFLLAAFRGLSVGSDTPNYVDKFLEIRELSFGTIFSNFFTTRMEIGYVTLTKLIGLFTANCRVFLFVNALLVYAGMFFYTYYFRDTKDDLTYIILFICTGLLFYSFNTVRQMLAMVLLLNSWGFLKKRNHLLSVLLFAISCTFHISALCFVAVYIVYFIRKKRIVSATLFGSGLILVLFLESIVKFLAKKLPMYRFYADHALTTAGGVWAIWAIELLIIAVCFFYYFDSKHFTKLLGQPAAPFTEIDCLCLPGFTLIYILFVSLGTKFNYMERIGLYFLPFCIPLFCNFVHYIPLLCRAVPFLKDKSVTAQKVYVIGLHVCFIAYFMLTAFSPVHAYSFT